MKALFALFLLASPSWAGVVMPVENGVAPARPSAPAVPVAAPGGGALGAPSLGSGADLRGAIPVLPSPVPGLLGPARHFVGQADAAAAASVRPEAAAVRPASGQATAARTRASDLAPALPAKASPGSPSLAVSRDRKAAASTPDDAGVLSDAARGATTSNPLADASSLENARPEKAAGLGRAFFDQSDESRRGALEDPSASGGAAPAIAASIPEGGMFALGRGARGRLSPANAEAAFGAGHGPSRSAGDLVPEGETLLDAVASVPGAAAAGGGAAAVMYRSAAPNGRLPGSPAEAAASAVPLPVLGAPRPLALDLSPSGLVVRVRSALVGSAASVPSAAASPRLAAPGPSTALLERGAMLEAFSVARAFAESVPGARTPAARSREASPAAPLAPAAEPATVPLWWAWFLLPLFVAAVRGIL